MQGLFVAPLRGKSSQSHESQKSRTHIYFLAYRLIVILYPPLDVHDADKETEVGSERVVVFLCLECGRDAVLGYDVEVDVSERRKKWSASFVTSWSTEGKTR